MRDGQVGVHGQNTAQMLHGPHEPMNTKAQTGALSLQRGRPLRIKKIPPRLRRGKISFNAESTRYKRILWRLREDPHLFRSTVQLSFVLLCVWIGVEFHLFVKWGLSDGLERYVSRPPGAEGFLPISALISLNYWVHTGIINTIHPSGLFILLAITAVSLLLKKAFCSWLCPIGTLSEALWMLGQKLFRRNIVLPRWLDYPLRSLKYLLLLFFLWSIGSMTVPDLRAFIYSPYNRMADVKMYIFFAEISTVALWTIIILMLLSVVVKNFWCRYLCPYGAFLGALSWLSPVKITRNRASCIDCELCTKACPALIRVHKVGRVWSDECTSCLGCIQVCPVKDTLDLRVGTSGVPVPPWVFGTLVVGIFVGITGLAMLSGHWGSDISKDEYLRRFQRLDSPLYQHNRGEVPAYGPQD